jgi:hypothetical protein
MTATLETSSSRWKSVGHLMLGKGNIPGMKARCSMMLVLWSLPLFALAADVHGGSKLAGYRYFIGYRPIVATNIEELPLEIRRKAVEHLKARLGDEFFAGLSFAGGQIVDVDAVYHANSRAKTVHPDIFSYDLHFQFARPDIGIEKYEAQIKFRKDGSLFEEIDLPAFRQNPEKRRLLHFSTIAELAAAAHFPKPIERAELGYSRERDEIIWRLSHKPADRAISGQRLYMEISAHDGNVLRTFESRSFH